MEWFYSALMVTCVLLSVSVLSIKCRSRFWLGGYMTFLSVYLGLILLDAQPFFISPQLYLCLLSILFLPGPLILGYVGHISSRRYIGAKDFILCLLPIATVTMAPEQVGGNGLWQFASEADYTKDSYVAIFNLVSLMAGIQTLFYLMSSFFLIWGLRKDWSSYQSKTLPRSWFRMVQVLIIVLLGTGLQLVSAFQNPAGDGVSIGDIGFILVVLFFIYQAVMTTKDNMFGVELDDEVILCEQDMIALPVPTNEHSDQQASIPNPQTLDAEQQVLMQQIRAQQLFLQSDLSLSSLAEQLNMTTHRLSESLNQYFQKSFYELINDLRVKHAANALIEQPSVSITDVFYSAGFTSKSTFYAYFKKVYGCTPTQYRQREKNIKLF